VKTARPIVRERADVFTDSNVIELTTRGKRTLPSSPTRAWNEAYLGRFWRGRRYGRRNRPPFRRATSTYGEIVGLGFTGAG
jgi:hypothetical protein